MTVEQLYELAAIEYPITEGMCIYKKKKALYKRDQWVKAKLAEQQSA